MLKRSYALVPLTLILVLLILTSQAFAGVNPPGDCNLDGSVDLLDVDPFITLIGVGDYLEECDMNLDGAVNLLDVDPFIDALAGK